MKNFKKMNNSQLVNRLYKLKKSLFFLRNQIKIGEVSTHGDIKKNKKNIARIYTLLKERVLNIN